MIYMNIQMTIEKLWHLHTHAFNQVIFDCCYVSASAARLNWWIQAMLILQLILYIVDDVYVWFYDKKQNTGKINEIILYLI